MYSLLYFSQVKRSASSSESSEEHAIAQRASILFDMKEMNLELHEKEY